MTDVTAPPSPAPPFRRQFDAARDPLTARNALGITSLGGGAPANAQYITATPDATLTNELVLTNTATVTWDFTTPGQAKANAATGGGGNVSNVGTPANGQYAKWTGATTIQGVAPATVLSDIGAQPAGSYQPLDGDLTSLAAAASTNAIYYRSAASTWNVATITAPLAFTAGALTVDLTAYLTTAAAAAAYQPLDGDLTSLAAASATGAIYYRSAANTWATVTIGSGISFSGGTLSASGSAGVTSLNSLTGALSIAAGTGITVTPSTPNIAVGLSTARQTTPTRQVFTTGSGTYTTPANVLWIEVELIGGGGGGGGGSTAANGSNGNNTTFSTITGGAGSGGIVNGPGGAGGTASGGDINLAGAAGQAIGNRADGATASSGSNGGGGPFGGAGYGGQSATGGAAVANTGGGGGGGGNNSTVAGNFGGGGGGAGGYCRKIIGAPAATYSYSVGGGGGGGAVGSTGFAGGAGGSGLIIVTEHYGS